MMVPQKMNLWITISSSNSLSGYIHKELKAGTQTDFCIPLFRAALCTIAKMHMCRWIAKQNVVHAYSGKLFNLNKERNSDTCYNMVNPEDIMLNETSQSQKNKYLIIMLNLRYLEQSNS